MRRVAVLVVLVGVTAVASAASNRRPSDAERGRELYERHCLACHGAGARGDGPATADLVADVPDAPDLAEATVDEQVDLVLLGRQAMPGFEASFDRYDARRVLRHMARLRAKPQPKTTAREAPPPTGQQQLRPAVEPPPSLRRKPPVDETDAPGPTDAPTGPPAPRSPE